MRAALLRLVLAGSFAVLVTGIGMVSAAAAVIAAGAGGVIAALGALAVHGGDG